MTIIREGSFKCIPKTSGVPRRPVVPWWNNDCATSRKITRRCYHKFKRRPCLVNKLAYRCAQAKQKRVFKRAKRESFIAYINELKTDSPLILVWNRLRKLQGKFVPSPLPILKIDGILVSDPKEVAEALGRHFASVSSTSHYPPEFQAVRNDTTVIPPLNTDSHSYNIPFSMEELHHALSLSSETSPGDDDVHYSMVSHLPPRSQKFFWIF